MSRIQITVAELDSILESNQDTIYWENGIPKTRREIFDDCKIIAIELDNTFKHSRLRPCISIYVGERTREEREKT